MQIIQVVGYKNAGKTTLTCELIRMLASEGYRVGTLKHDAHDFEPELPGKDTWQHRQAGAQITAITSPTCTAWVQRQSTPLDQLVSQMAAHALDYLIIEGFKSASYPKIVLLRNEEDADLLALPSIMAAITRVPNPYIESLAELRNIPVFIKPDRDFDVTPVLSYIRNHCHKRRLP